MFINYQSKTKTISVDTFSRGGVVCRDETELSKNIENNGDCTSSKFDLYTVQDVLSLSSIDDELFYDLNIQVLDLIDAPFIGTESDV